MICPVCKSENVTVQVVQTSMETRERGRGCLWAIGRGLLICCTFGLWLIVGKSKGKNKTKIQSSSQAVCQNCGNRWTI